MKTGMLISLAGLKDSTFVSEMEARIVYPKGIESINEGKVLVAIRRAGLADVKVASFSATHAALKGVVRKTQRAAR